MILQSHHFDHPTLKNFHFFREDTSLPVVKEALTEISMDLNLFLGVLNGAEIRSQEDLLSNLWSVLRFPAFDGGGAYNDGGGAYNWDSASDWIGDLSWIEEQSNGIIILYIEPKALFVNQADIFGLFLDIIGDRSEARMSNGPPLHFVAGPINHRINNFLNILAVREHLCDECLYGWHSPV
ncbi:MAG TPA: hypothetical protein VNL35_13055 [Chloroflexota bacterium]|nr:hypothetical protein [Chloroflexota bacterium]